MKLFWGLGRGFQTNRSEGVQMGEIGGGPKLKPNPQKGRGVPNPTRPQTTLNALFITGFFNALQRTQKVCT